MWLRAVRRSQDRWLSALDADDRTEALVAAALSLHDFAREEPGGARLLASLGAKLVAAGRFCTRTTVTDDAPLPLRASGAL